MGTTTLDYAVTDAGGLVATCSSNVTVEDTQPPMISCPERVSIECTGNRGTAFSPLPAVATDVCAGVSVDNPEPGIFPVGTSELLYTATDEVGLVSTCFGEVAVIDTTPPTVENVSASPAMLWPPNHTMIEVNLEVDAFDTCDAGEAAPTCAITGISSNQPANDIGDGNTDTDWEITGQLTANLRAERNGRRRSGRIYTLEVTCADLAGNTTVDSVTVGVGRDRRRST